MIRNRRYWVFGLVSVIYGCSGTENAGTPGAGGSGAGGVVSGSGGAVVAGASATGGSKVASSQGGTVGTGGAVTSGGAPLAGGAFTGGAKASGGALPSGGSPGTGGGVATLGGTSTAGGAIATGGSKATGGAISTGGSNSSGGTRASGGVVGSGGTKASGGSALTGGTKSTGGAATGGAVPTGGSKSTGGAPSTGGAVPTGGSSSTCAKHSATATFTNPLNASQGSDPYMFYYKCNYYLTATTWNSQLTVKKSPTIAGLKTATASVVWDGAQDDASRCCNYWAPEIHQLNGPNGLRWYFYYTGGPGPNGGDTGNQKNHVIESAGDDPMGPYTYKGHVHDSNDTWAIDSSVVTINGSLYFLFSAWEGSNQDIYIAAMSNPWTMTGSRVRISQPTYTWEQQLANVNEGPVALQHGGKTFVAYSASACWGPSYAIGLLTLTGTNPLSASSWTKSANPVFLSGNGVYGPAHNGFFKSPDGAEDWIVYHANNSSAGVCDTRRTTRIQKFTWNSDGSPNFGTPVATTTAITVPSGE